MYVCLSVCIHVAGRDYKKRGESFGYFRMWRNRRRIHSLVIAGLWIETKFFPGTKSLGFESIRSRTALSSETRGSMCIPTWNIFHREWFVSGACDTSSLPTISLSLSLSLSFSTSRPSSPVVRGHRQAATWKIPFVNRFGNGKKWNGWKRFTVQRVPSEQRLGEQHDARAATRRTSSFVSSVNTLKSDWIASTSNPRLEFGSRRALLTERDAFMELTHGTTYARVRKYVRTPREKLEIHRRDYARATGATGRVVLFVAFGSALSSITHQVFDCPRASSTFWIIRSRCISAVKRSISYMGRQHPHVSLSLSLSQVYIVSYIGCVPHFLNRRSCEITVTVIKMSSILLVHRWRNPVGTCLFFEIMGETNGS